MSLEKKSEFQNSKSTKIEKNLESKKKDIIFKIEQFYKKPKNQKELIKNIRILKEIPTDISDPKVVIKLGNRDKSHKFVFMEDEDKRKYLIALPIEKKEYHSEIVDFAKKLYKKKFKVYGGGYIYLSNDNLLLAGRSESFGEELKDLIKEILEKKFPGLKVKVLYFENPDNDKVKQKKYLSEALDKIKTSFQKEFYISVLNNAIKMGFDYTKLPESIENREDLVYMIYSSENGTNFDFDTLYLGYKDKDNKMKIKLILRERWYIKINEIVLLKNNQINFKYEVNNEQKELIIFLDKIEDFKMVDNLNDKERKIVKIYENNQNLFENSLIYHGVK